MQIFLHLAYPADVLSILPILFFSIESVPISNLKHLSLTRMGTGTLNLYEHFSMSKFLCEKLLIGKVIYPNPPLGS